MASHPQGGGQVEGGRAGDPGASCAKLLTSPRHEQVVLGIELLRQIGCDIDTPGQFRELLGRDLAANADWFCRWMEKEGRNATWGVPHLIYIIEDAENCYSRVKACAALCVIGPPAGGAAVPALVKSLEHPNGTLRRYAAKALFLVKADAGRRAARLAHGLGNNHGRARPDMAHGSRREVRSARQGRGARPLEIEMEQPVAHG